jgi:hypothetical protein
MKLSKKSGGIAVAVVMAGGITAASATAAFAAPAGTPHTKPVAKTTDKTEKKTAEKDAAQDAAHTAKHKGGHARFLTGTHGEKTVKGKDGKTVTHEWQVGKVTAASATSLTVKSSDGVSWTWTTSAGTKVHSPKHAAPKVGDEVLVEGVKSGTVNDARVVLDPGQAQIAKWTQQVPGQDNDKANAQAGKQDADKTGKQDTTDTGAKGKHRKAPTAPVQNG